MTKKMEMVGMDTVAADLCRLVEERTKATPTRTTTVVINHQKVLVKS